MQPIVLESDRVVARLTHRGAELTSLVLKETGREYLWQGDPAWWTGRAPLLFPVVGRLRDDHYVWQGRRYTLPQHGFARESNFDLMQSDRRCASFLLSEAGAWLDRFPQEFNLAVTWELDGATITARHDVFNPSTHDDLLFSLGAHPGFRWPLEDGRAHDDYRLVFEHSETCERLEVDSDGLLTGRRLPFFRDQNLLKLRSDLFRGGAIVLQGLRSETITFSASDEGPSVTLAAAGFPYFGIWSRPDAPFLCLEPWHGVADTAGADWDLRNKPGIVCLPPGESWSCRISITIR